MSKKKKLWLGSALGVVLCIGIAIAVYQVFFSNRTTSVEATGNLMGSVNDTLQLSNGLSITLTQVQRSDTHIMLHFSARNNGQQNIQLVSDGQAPHFYAASSAGAFIPASSVTTANRNAYPALPSTLASGKSTDGWITVETTKIGPISSPQILYAFGASPSTSCKNPNDTSTCHADNAYKALIWDFQLPA